ncbi:STAS/SEC14 domain-containing protein [Neolewinella agarilytica]|uniref:STAS/SEC14 domain-containing protein n=1 Tax=Neolewinella agarilytica TaxID=478744 RepID=UPI00399D24D6
MLIIDTSKDHIFRYVISGKLNAGDLTRYYCELEKQYQRKGRLAILVTVSAFRGYANPKALRVFLLNEYKLLSRVSHYAAVSDQSWFVTAIRCLNFFLPHIRLRSFKPDQLAEAEDWLHKQTPGNSDTL